MMKSKYKPGDFVIHQNKKYVVRWMSDNMASIIPIKYSMFMLTDLRASARGFFLPMHRNDPIIDEIFDSELRIFIDYLNVLVRVGEE